MSLVREGLLALTTVGPAYGLQLRNELASRTQRSINGGQAYSTLERLERDGLLHEVGRTADKLLLFEATAAGREHVANWLSSPSGGYEAMVFQVSLALSLPNHSSAALIDAYRRSWQQPGPRSGSETPHGALFLRADELLAEAALAWLEEASNASDTGWGFSAHRPRRGRRPKVS